jgi:hypothetical protein
LNTKIDKYSRKQLELLTKEKYYILFNQRKVSIFAHLIIYDHKIGEMPEWSNGAVSKTAVLGNWDRGFESLSLRQKNNQPAEKRVFYLPADRANEAKARDSGK